MLEFQLPVYEVLVNLNPILGSGGIVYLHRYAPHVLLVVRVRRLRDDILLMDILLQRQQYLVRVYRLDKVIGNLRPNGLVHDILLLALGHHHYRDGRLHLLDERQCLQPRESRHVLVQQNQVVATFASDYLVLVISIYPCRRVVCKMLLPGCQILVGVQYQNFEVTSLG